RHTRLVSDWSSDVCSSDLTVRNFTLSPDFSPVNWIKVFSAGYFRDSYVRTFLYAVLAAAVASVLGFPCAFALAFRVSPGWRRICLLMLITPYFTSYLVRVYSWKVLLPEEGVINFPLRTIGLGPYPMLNNLFGTTVGYLTLCFPLVVLLQLLSLSNVDKRLIEAAHNLGCGRIRTVFAVTIP